MHIETVVSQSDIANCFPLIKQLRPHLDFEKYQVQIQNQRDSAGYTLIYLEDQAEIKSVLGYRITDFLAWGKVLYIDDLITDEKSTGKGYAGILLDWVFAKAKELHCDQVHLDSGYQRHDAHRLYLKKGMKLACHHFSKDIL
jgi:GNAT superfamily N-acetyltransferase